MKTILEKCALMCGLAVLKVNESSVMINEGGLVSEFNPVKNHADLLLLETTLAIWTAYVESPINAVICHKGGGDEVKEYFSAHNNNRVEAKAVAMIKLAGKMYDIQEHERDTERPK